ncbi:MAG: hypothetical protein U0694_24640 [Anaerolineae bacterium]
MHDSLNLDALAAEAQARWTLRRRLNIALAVCAGVCLLLFFLTSFTEDPSPEVMIVLTFLLIGLGFIYLFGARSSIGWGLILYAFRPGRELLRQFPPMRINWRPWLVTAVGLAGFVGVTLGMPLGALAVTGVLLAGMFAQMQAMSAMQRGNFDTVLRYTRFATRWLMFPNLFGYQQVALVNSRRYDEAVASAVERLATAPRLAPCLAEPLHGQVLALLAAKRYDEVLPPLEQALRLLPEAGNMYMTLADLYLEHFNEPSRALAVLDAARPFIGVFEYNWRLFHARTFAHLGRFADADAELAQAGKMNALLYPQIIGKTSLLFATVDVKCQARDLDAARAALRELEAISPDGSQTRAARQRLDEIERGDS